MNADNEYINALTHLYEKSLILHDTSLFNKTLYFYFIDAIAHIDYTCSIYAFNYQSPKNIMGAEYLRWRIDEEKGDRPQFTAFIAWLKIARPENLPPCPHFGRCSTTWKIPQGTGFRIVLDPDSRQEIPANFFIAVIDEFFEQDFLKSLYEDASLSTLFTAFIAEQKT